MRISKEDFEKMLAELAEKNFKVKLLLDVNGSFDKIPEFQRNLVATELGIKAVYHNVTTIGGGISTSTEVRYYTTDEKGGN